MAISTTAAAVIGLGMAAAGTGMSVMGSLQSGQAARAGANAQAKLSALDNEKSLLNAVMSMYEADRQRDEMNLDLEYMGFATQRQAQWLRMLSDYDQSMAQSKAALSAKNAALGAVDKGTALVGAASSEAQGLVAGAALQAAQARMQTRFKAVMQGAQDSEALGLRHAGLGTRGMAFSGSALDVLEHEQAMGELRQQAISIMGGMQVDDIQAGARNQASLRMQGAYRQAADLMGGTLSSIDEQNTALAASLARSRVEHAREAALVEEEGWRTAMKFRMNGENSIARTQMGASNQMLQGAGSLGQAASYRAAGEASASAAAVSAGSSLLSGASKMMGMYTEYAKPLKGS